MPTYALCQCLSLISFWFGCFLVGYLPSNKLMFISTKMYVKSKMWILNCCILYISVFSWWTVFSDCLWWELFFSNEPYWVPLHLCKWRWFSFQNIAPFSECVRNSLTLTIMYNHPNVLESSYNNYYLKMFIDTFQELRIVRSQWWRIWTLGSHCRSSWIWW